MNYLLVMPRGLSKSKDQYFHVFAVGIAYVSASMKKAGYRVSTMNLDYLEGDSASLLKGVMERDRIDVVCTGGLSRDWSGIKEIVDIARGVRSDVVCVVGGGLSARIPNRPCAFSGRTLALLVKVKKPCASWVRRWRKETDLERSKA